MSVQPEAGQSRLTIVPCELEEANALVRRWHRHHDPVTHHRFSLAVIDEASVVRGVCIVDRPAARMRSDRYTAEVRRLATDECPNACSALYGAAWRAARALGYRRLVTYILDSEPGTSLRAAGWICTGDSAGGSWSRPSRLRSDHHPLRAKARWEVAVTTPNPPAALAWPECSAGVKQLPLALEAQP